ncbi:MAG TPA: glycosyltransferase family 2 protein [Acidimicrobiales bacterium]|nr:glycosyltransferase family 2 protein [Acidimicrobiales bacterium]
MSTEPLVSIVTPSLNQGRFIRETIESVLAQTYASIEYVVLDAGSTDETHDVLASYGDKVRWKVAADKGQADAINNGWQRETTGSILAWLNADDLLEPDAVAQAVAALTARPDAAGVYGDAVEFFEDGTEYRAPVVAPFNLWRLINIFDYIVQPATFLRRAAVEEAGWLDDSLHYGMDWDLFIRLGVKRPLVYVPKTFARARIHAAAKTRTGGRTRFRELARIIRRYAPKRRPPAYWYYASETYRSMANRWVAQLEASGHRFTRRALNSLTYRGFNLMAKRTYLSVDDWFEDGWTGPDVKFLLPPGPGRVHLDGNVPADLAPQSVVVVAAGEEVWSGTLDEGPFAIAFDGRRDPDAGPLPVSVRATRWHHLPHPGGHVRRASYLLYAVERR